VKTLKFFATSLKDLQRFPPQIRNKAGHALFQVQTGRSPEDWKPISVIGSGVQEIRIFDDIGAFRVIYVAKFAEAIYVLHCFQKKTQKTSQSDLDLASKRYRDLLKEIKQ
jgi:phage-related protein